MGTVHSNKTRKAQNTKANWGFHFPVGIYETISTCLFNAWWCEMKQKAKKMHHFKVSYEV